MARPPVEQRASRIAKETPAYQQATLALGANVRRLRQDQSLTLEEAAERMDLDLKHLQKIEAGQTNIPSPPYPP